MKHAMLIELPEELHDCLADVETYTGLSKSEIIGSVLASFFDLAEMNTSNPLPLLKKEEIEKLLQLMLQHDQRVGTLHGKPLKKTVQPGNNVQDSADDHQLYWKLAHLLALQAALHQTREKRYS
ncbi:hypothetical protein [Vagococcus acidifermentans]|uniref:Uncharacterized protein n=1 Tax=Vagococcus acidifermentans TaxID=564710 RepID=A0A430AY13_9ENTE|nr:hypothetical protein [Vagococcus acidifermentans]RSU12926.1 hypothetical protein CBF27_05135 [Vagococcus acidifermentans]